MIPASKYQVLENGDLIVNNLTISDIGLYQCSVSNQYSFGLSKKRQGTVLLDIYGKKNKIMIIFLIQILQIKLVLT